MSLKNFEELLKLLDKNTTTKKIAVVNAMDQHSLEGIFSLKHLQAVEPILIGNVEKIKEILKILGESIEDIQLIETQNDVESAEKAVELARNGQVDIIMKGKIQTKDLLRAVVAREKGIKKSNVLSHIALYELPSYSKLLLITDGGMILTPSLAEKKAIIENALFVLHQLGYIEPKIGVLSATEHVNPKLQDSVDGAQLKAMNQNGEITGCIIEGPISLDLALSKEISEEKNYAGRVTGDADILLVPDITAGNILGKSFSVIANGKMAGVVMGANVPIILTSRGSTSEEKLNSIILALLLSEKK
ncbi:bifunctional enoyl-CoA hydratase/phosphate acetyltransferase [Neobacillus sp. PS3-40]|uniref:bifunctional enoyl-CoA hydratase/phosphate acetyltransferase n=1 Tax=Neobacillus sp. PS3-40 TaxID=3070679 RepID=UPI0027E07A83|nr:bifunctional enoyl-CoA hydratase/phosphate acetyltransferase [Neobacillus sp. PS3-40]WML44698.1 bifunctional enoyl-CoA hydratase/phosphate acetyltransferase [Neobacillus sp. PS3-40]